MDRRMDGRTDVLEDRQLDIYTYTNLLTYKYKCVNIKCKRKNFQLLTPELNLFGIKKTRNLTDKLIQLLTSMSFKCNNKYTQVYTYICTCNIDLCKCMFLDFFGFGLLMFMYEFSFCLAEFSSVS